MDATVEYGHSHNWPQMVAIFPNVKNIKMSNMSRMSEMSEMAKF